MRCRVEERESADRLEPAAEKQTASPAEDC